MLVLIDQLVLTIEVKTRFLMVLRCDTAQNSKHLMRNPAFGN